MVTPLLPHPGSVAGGALVMHGQLAELARRHEVTLATLAGPDSAEEAAVDEVRRLGVDVRPVWRHAAPGMARLVNRARLARAWLGGDQPLRTLKFRDPRLQELVDRVAHERRFDVVQVEDNALGTYRYPDGVPTVLTEHEVRACPSAPGRGGLERGRWMAYQRRVWSRFNRVQVFTEWDAAALRALAPEVADRLRVNPFGVTPGPAADPAREAAGEVVFVGSFYHPPNVDAALWLGREIFPLLRSLAPTAHLTIVGIGPPPSVRALAGPAVTVTGRVERVEPFLERAQVVLAPLRLGGGMRVKVLQAMGLGKAVVTTPLGAEGLGPGNVAPPLAAAEAAAGIARETARLLADAAAREDLGRRARAFVLEHHGWPAYARRLEAVYAELGVAS